MMKRVQIGSGISTGACPVCGPALTKSAYAAMAAVLLMGLALAPVAQAHPYLYFGPLDDAGNTLETTPPADFTPWTSLYDVASNFDAYLGGMMTPTIAPHAGCDLWVSATCADGANTPIWTTVKGQEGPGWIGTNNGTDGAPNWAYTGSGSIDDRRIRMLDKLLDPAASYSGVPADRVTAIRDAFAANVAKTLDNELTLYNVRIRATASILGLPGSADSTQTITTGGQTAPIPFKVFGATAYTVAAQDIPNLWKTRKSMLRSANGYIRDAAVNMSAAYMTMGDPLVTNYWYALMGTMGVTAVNQMLPSLISGIGKSNTGELTAPDLDTAIRLALGTAMSQVTVTPADSGEKAAVSCGPWGTINDLDVTITVTVDTIGDVPIHITASGADLCQSITEFAAKFVVGANKYTSAAQYLATDGIGDLNGDGTTNLQSYNAAGGDLTAYLAKEGIAPPVIPITGSVVINNNRSATNNLQITLALTWGGGSGTGVVRMRFSDDGSHWTAWQSLAATLPYTLPAGPDGHRTVRVQFLDKLNNKSAIFSDYINLDTVLPTGTIIINGGALSTPTQAVSLGLTWADAGAGVSRMRFSDDGAHWSAWEPPTTPRAYALPLAVTGYQTVRVQFRDGADNVSTTYNDYIKLIIK